MELPHQGLEPSSLAWCSVLDLNQRLLPCDDSTLPAELTEQILGYHTSHKSCTNRFLIKVVMHVYPPWWNQEVSDLSLDLFRVTLIHLSYSSIFKYLERVMGFEPTAFCLASKHSTTELHPQFLVFPLGFEPRKAANLALRGINPLFYR